MRLNAKTPARTIESTEALAQAPSPAEGPAFREQWLRVGNYQSKEHAHMRKLMRKRIFVPVAAIAAIAVAGIAVAYFTASGTGSGTASVGAAAGVTIDNVTFDSALYPGGSTTVRYTISNPSADTAVQVSKVVADTRYGTTGVDGLPVGCDASDFTFADVTVNASIPANRSADSTGTLRFADNGRNQDACQGASPVLHLKVDNSGI
jgi:hypothetical protein